MIIFLRVKKERDEIKNDLSESITDVSVNVWTRSSFFSRHAKSGSVMVKGTGTTTKHCIRWNIKVLFTLRIKTYEHLL